MKQFESDFMKNVKAAEEPAEECVDSFSDAEKEVILQAKKKAMRLLEFQDRTVKQLRDKLKEGDFPPFAVDEAIAYVQSYHYLDDRRFADNYIRNKKTSKSRYQLQMELSEKGISSELVSELLEAEEWDGASVVASLFQKKYASKDPEDPKTYERAFRYFASHGFQYEEIKKGLEQALSEERQNEI